MASTPRAPHRPLLSLPQVHPRRGPNDQLLSSSSSSSLASPSSKPAQTSRRRQPAPLCSPYLKPGDKLHQALYFLPPLGGGSSTRRPKPAANNDGGGGSDGGGTPPAAARDTSDPNAATASTSNGADPAAQPATEQRERPHVNELTLTYLKVLQRSEDYNRRAILQDRDRHMKHNEAPWRQLNELVLAILRYFRAAQDAELAARTKLADEEAKARAALARQAEQSHQTAKRHEDIRPTCPLISQGQQVHLDPECAAGMTAELRWRGGTTLEPHFFFFDEGDRLLGTASRGDALRGVDGTVGCRLVNVSNGVTLGTGGTRVCFQLQLGNLPTRCHRVVIVAFNGRRDGVLSDLSRSWLTLYDAGRSPMHLGRELYACRSLDGGAYSAIVVASLTRRTGAVWIFRCLNEAVLCPMAPHELAPALPRSPAAFAALHFAFSRERFIGQAFGPIEAASRRVVVLGEEEERRELAGVCKIEYAKAHKRSLTARSYRAFSRSAPADAEEAVTPTTAELPAS